MLSFNRGRPIAHALDSKGNKVLTIHITPEQEKPDIIVDNTEELITDSDIDKIQRNMRLTGTEIKIIKKAI